MTPKTTKHTRARAHRACLAALVVAALAVAGCGGGDDGTPPRPAIEARVAEDLAARSEAVASALESGDICTAAVRADELVAAANDAVARGRIPRVLQDKLTSAAIGLQNEVNCPPPPAPTTVEEPDDEDRQRGKKRGKGKNDGEGDD